MVLFADAPIRSLGAIGDVHGCDETLEKAITFLRARTETVVCVGDIVDGPGDVPRCISLLEREAVVTVRGNHDRWFLEGAERRQRHATETLAPEGRAFLAGLFPELLLTTVAGSLLLCHGIGGDDMAALRPGTRGYGLRAATAAILEREVLLPDDLVCVLSGHTHERMARWLAPYWFFNAGTLLPEPEPVVLLLRVDARTAEFFQLPEDDPPTLMEMIGWKETGAV